MLRKSTFSGMALLAGVFALVGSQSVDAAFKVRVSYNNGGSFTTLVQDGMAGDLNTNVGEINFMSSTAGLSLNFSGATSKPTFGNPTLSVMTMHVQVALTGFVGTVIIDMTDTDFGVPSYPAGNGL